MAKVEVGDLVCMHRRKKKGVGIVLEHTDDIIEYAGVGICFDEFISNITEIDSDYNARQRYRDKLTDCAQHPDMINTCLIYNAGWARKPKKEFIRIRWFDRPSLYETSQITEQEQWCPADWVKKL